MKIPKNENVMSHDARMAVLETTVGHIHETLERLDKRFDVIDQRFNSIDRKFEAIDRKFEAVDSKFEKMFEKMDDKVDSLRKEMISGFRDINNRLWFNFIWVVGGFIGVLTLIARLFHWF